MNWTEDRPFQALTLTGGGYRGLFTAKALATIEDHIGHPIGRHFDLLSGTSIGGVIALAAALDVSMKRVVEVFTKWGPKIFPPRQRRTNRFRKYIDAATYALRPRYSTAPLREAIAELIDSRAVLGDALYPVAIPAVNLTAGKPQLFKTRHIPAWNRDSRLNVIDVALATAAAPTFFELAEVDGAWYADGGLFANAPDLIAVHEAEHFFDVPVRCMRVLSVGTTTEKYSVSFTAGRSFGILDWMEDERLFSVMISSQQQFVDQLMTHRLNNRYLRIDIEPSDTQARDLGLDIATPAAIATLTALAQKAVSDLLAGAELPVYLAHVPQLKPLPKN
jgi:patatin-like phospholipase/acyl hydrolase